MKKQEDLSISIVMPIHNTGKYLSESIGSILKQTYQGYELLCIDDASDDEQSLEILTKYAESDERIKLYRMETAVGAAEARNYGLHCAAGEYVIFLDSDDLFSEDMLELMYNCAVETEADFCISGFRLFSDKTGKEVKRVFPRKVRGITDRVFRAEELGEEALCFWNPGPWNKLFHRSFVMEKGITFQSLKSSNDVSFTLACTLEAKSIAYVNSEKPLQSYRVGNPNQISSNRCSSDFVTAVEYAIMRYSAKRDGMEIRQLLAFLASGLIWELQNDSDESRREKTYQRAVNIIRQYYHHSTYISGEIENLLKQYMSLPYNSNWFEAANYYFIQLMYNSESFLAQLPKIKEEAIVVWGRGNRGEGLLRFLVHSGYSNILTADRENNNIGDRTPEGAQIIHTDVALSSCRCIVSSNRDIHYSLQKRMHRKNVLLINGEEYCRL